jgi:hypothetical protein
VGTDLCMVRPTGDVVAGRAVIRRADGTAHAVGAGDAFDVPPGHAMGVIGEEPDVAGDCTTAQDAPAPLQRERVRHRSGEG